MFVWGCLLDHPVVDGVGSFLCFVMAVAFIFVPPSYMDKGLGEYMRYMFFSLIVLLLFVAGVGFCVLVVSGNGFLFFPEPQSFFGGLAIKALWLFFGILLIFGSWVSWLDNLQ